MTGLGVGQHGDLHSLLESLNALTSYTIGSPRRPPTELRIMIKRRSFDDMSEITHELTVTVQNNTSLCDQLYPQGLFENWKIIESSGVDTGPLSLTRTNAPSYNTAKAVIDSWVHGLFYMPLSQPVQIIFWFTNETHPRLLHYRPHRSLPQPRPSRVSNSLV